MPNTIYAGLLGSRSGAPGVKRLSLGPRRMRQHRAPVPPHKCTTPEPDASRPPRLRRKPLDDHNQCDTVE